MAHNTTRLGLNVVDGTDNVSAYPVADNQSKTILDTAVTFTSGTLAARPAAALNGRVYYATDNGQYYLDSGSSWQTMLVAGAWQAITLGTSLVAASSAYVPSVRLEGDVARLKGAARSTSNGTIGAIGTVPTGFRPSNTVEFSVQFDSGASSATAQIGVNGAILIISPPLPALATVYLDGATYTLS